MSDLMPYNDENQLREAFNFVDRNGEGQITKDRLGSFMRQLKANPSESELQDLMNEVDEKADGAIDFDEFHTLMMYRQESNDATEELTEAFNVFDSDHDGLITTVQLRQIILDLDDGKNLSCNEINEIVRLADAQNNGHIDREQFIRVMNAS